MAERAELAAVPLLPAASVEHDNARDFPARGLVALGKVDFNFATVSDPLFKGHHLSLGGSGRELAIGGQGDAEGQEGQ
jgi:hypothetical protein